MYADKRWDMPVLEPVQLSPERQALLNAADYIEKHGWCQGAYQSGNAVCAVGAILRVTPRDANDSRQVAERAGYLLARSAGIGSPVDVSTWNDEPGRTKEHVISAMRNAAIE